jgi:hypothetical protein
LEGIISKSKNGKYDVGNCTRNIIAHLTAIASAIIRPALDKRFISG